MAMTIEELEDALIGRAFKVGDKVKLNASALSRTYVAEPGTRANPTTRRTVPTASSTLNWSHEER